MTSLHYLDCFYMCVHGFFCVCMCSHTRKRRQLSSVFNPLGTCALFQSGCPIVLPTHSAQHSGCLLVHQHFLPSSHAHGQLMFVRMFTCGMMKRCAVSTSFCSFLFEQTDGLRLYLDEPACLSHWTQHAGCAGFSIPLCRNKNNDKACWL